LSEPERLRKTEAAQLALRGEAPPPFEMAVNLGAPLDLESGIIRCPVCGIDGVELVQVVSHPAGSYPTNAAIELSCATCSRPFAITVEQVEGRCVLAMARPRR
jgi:hypothetical protein